MKYTFLDKLLITANNGLKTLSSVPATTSRAYPAENIKSDNSTQAQQKHIAGLMRINHAGEIAAQGLYFGQMLSAHQDYIYNHLHQAALEEGDHLYWCQKRVKELNSHTSYLAPLWYIGSVTIGTLSGLLGDGWSMGFLVETETQVENHLQTHIDDIPLHDQRSHAILQQMKLDEASHAAHAEHIGSKELPPWAKKLMTFTATIMKKISYTI